MDDAPTQAIPTEPVAAALSRGLAAGDAVLGTVPGVLRHLLVHDDAALFTEELLARTRGMITDLAGQFLAAFDSALADAGPVAPERAAPIEQVLIGVPPLLAHLHATALEWQVGEALRHRLGLDPVLSPLVQALVASPDGETGAAAMRMLAAQARFLQQQRQMRLPVGELPPDLLHLSLVALAEFDRDGQGAAAIRARYDESTTRLGLLGRLVTSMGAGAIAALSLGHGGLALFVTTMAIACEMPRDVCLLATEEGQSARLALALRSAGLRSTVVEDVLLALHPGSDLRLGIGDVSPEQASAMLAASSLAGMGR